MPIYEYQCQECEQVFEEIASAKDKDNARTCPACGSKTARRLMSTFAIGKPASGSSVSCPTCSTGTCNLS